MELHDVVEVPRVPTKAWRQQATEAVVRLALALQAQGRDLLLAGDPVAAGELIAAPSADQLDSVAVCLLDVDQEAQFARLSARGDDPASFVHHAAFADWMRGHAADPGPQARGAADRRLGADALGAMQRPGGPRWLDDQRT